MFSVTMWSTVNLLGVKSLCCILLFSWSRTRQSRTWANTLPGTESNVMPDSSGSRACCPFVCRRAGWCPCASRQEWRRCSRQTERSKWAIPRSSYPRTSAALGECCICLVHFRSLAGSMPSVPPPMMVCTWDSWVDWSSTGCTNEIFWQWGRRTIQQVGEMVLPAAFCRWQRYHQLVSLG